MGVLERIVAECLAVSGGHGMKVAHGELSLPDDLSPERVRLLTGALRGEPFPCSDTAMVWFLGRAGVAEETCAFIGCFIEGGTLNFVDGFARLPWRQRLAIGYHGFQALTVFSSLADYLNQRLDPPLKAPLSLHEVVIQLRHEVAGRLECPPDWDEILSPARSAGLRLLAEEWSD